MGYGSSRGTHRIELKGFDGSDNWVDIRQGRTVAQATRLNAMMTGMDAQSPDADKLYRAVCTEFLVDWSLKADDADERPMPLTEDTFSGELDSDVGAWIIEQVLAYYNRRRLPEGSDERGNSNGSSTAASVAAAGSR